MDNYYPPVGLHFKVTFEGLSEETDNRFQEVTGLTATVNTEDVEEGGVNRFVHKLPKGTSYDNLILKRGIIKDSKLVAWCRKAIEDLTFEPKNILVILLNEEHQELCSWNIINAYPVKWAFSGLNAESGELLIENMEFNYQYFNVQNL
ncbi:MAG: phage tail protein [Pricia sp.]